MTDNINKLMAEALVECGHAAETYESDSLGLVIQHEKGGRSARTVNPFAKTKEGYEQAFALEDWLHNEHYNLIQQAKVAEMLQKDNPNNDFMGQYNGRQKRLNRIKWCFEQLAEKS